MTHGIQVPTKYTKMTYQIMIMRAFFFCSFQFLDTIDQRLTYEEKKHNLTLHIMKCACYASLIMWGKQ